MVQPQSRETHAKDKWRIDEGQALLEIGGVLIDHLDQPVGHRHTHVRRDRVHVSNNPFRYPAKREGGIRTPVRAYEGRGK